MSSISQSSISVSSIAKCYRVCCSETPRTYNSNFESSNAFSQRVSPCDADY